MSSSPCVSVVMPVFNGERYLKEAVEGILNQTFGDFEFIIINDGSTDNTRGILESYADARIKLVEQEHQGLIASLNRGLAIAGGEYVARMDSDDIAAPERLEKQVAFLRTHPKIGILGTACRIIDDNGRDLGVRRWPISDLEIRWTGLFSSPFGHPTVILRRDILTKHGLEYDDVFHMVEDYDLWIRALNHTRGANLNEPLLKYRVHGDRVTSKFRDQQLRSHDAVALRALREQLPEFVITPEQVSQFRGLFVGGSEFMPGLDVRRVTLAELYLDMLRAFMSHRHGEPGLERLQRREALRIARLVFRWPLRPGWMRVIRRLIKLEPGLPWRFSGYLWHAACRRLVPRRHRLKLARDLVAVGTKSGLPAE